MNKLNLWKHIQRGPYIFEQWHWLFTPAPDIWNELITLRFKWQLSSLHTYQINCGGIGAQNVTVQKLTDLTVYCAETVLHLCFTSVWALDMIFNKWRPNSFFVCKYSQSMSCRIHWSRRRVQWECLWGQQSAGQSRLVSNDTETENIS